MRRQSLTWAVLLVLLSSLSAMAQTGTALIRGTVTDSTGGVIIGAKVTLKGEGTGFSRSAETNASGIYTFRDLPVGSYELSVERTGFKTVALKNVVLNVADQRAQDVTLEAGQLGEQLSVEASAVQVKTMGGDVSGLVTGEQARELPLNGRNFVQLTSLVAGDPRVVQLAVKFVF